MVRIIGILCGSALAISFLILALGVPDFLPKTQIPAELFVEPILETMPEPVPESESEAMSELEVEALIEAVLEGPPDTAIGPVPKENPDEPLTEELLAQASTEHWFAFWSPFRSELAANGFVSQLQKTTGMDYRVVRLKPGVFEVAFAYEGESDIETKLAAISAATGLEMPDG